MDSSITQEQAAAELLRRYADTCAAIRWSELTDGHEYQARILRCSAVAMLWMCSRRAGKSRLACLLLLQTAIATAGCSCLYLGLTKGSAEIIWRRHWLPLLRKTRLYKLCQINETKQRVIFPSGATVTFGGIDDLKNVTHLLGDSMASGIAIIDESQDDPGMIEVLVRDVLGPMLDETTATLTKPGRLVVSGTVPDQPVGFFYKTWAENYDEESRSTVPGAHWECFSWSRFDNPHEKDNEWHAENWLKRYKLDREDPLYLRMWRGVRAWERTATCFRYRAEFNSWVGVAASWASSDMMPAFKLTAAVPPGGIDTFWAGIDPAQATDRFAITLFGTANMRDLGIWHVAEAVSDWGGDPFETQWLAVIKLFKERYGRIARVIRDPGSNAETNDVLLRSHGVLIEPAIKGPGSLKGRVDRVADLLMTGALHVLAGSALEEDLIKTKWSNRERERGKWDFDGSWHPDVADSASYVIPAWTAVRQAPDPTAGMDDMQRAAYDAEQKFLKRFRDFKTTSARDRKPPPAGKSRISVAPRPWRT